MVDYPNDRDVKRSREYRDEARFVRRETFWTLRKALPIFLVVLVVAVFIGWGLKSAGIIGMNIEREVIQHSQQYVETKVNLLNKLHGDWLKLNADIAQAKTIEGAEVVILAKRAQRNNTLERIKTEASMIPSSQVPPAVQSFLSTH